MLNFLRKHQRFFFIVITAAIIVSFSFFGTYGAMNTRETAPNKEIVRGVCGKPVMQQDLMALSRLLEASAFARLSSDRDTLPHFLNDGVVEKDFLATGLGIMLAKRYFEELKDDLDPRVKKIHHFRPYAHPLVPQISAESAWARYSPGLLEDYRALKSRSDQPTTETLALMCKLYLDQALIPPDLLKQILAMQQNQLGVAPDPVLAHSDLALFGFKSMQDWFGPQFVSLVAQFILNAAQIAEERGYAVTTEEARADLFQNIALGYRHFLRDTALTSEDAQHHYQAEMRALGFDETLLISTWKKVMLFRRLFDDGSGSVLVDPLAYQQFDRFAKESRRIALYQLPDALRFPDFRSMLKFQTYLEAVSPDASRLRSDLHLPKQIASLAQIEKKVPELVERSIKIEWSSVSKEELGSSISIKETWNWETTDEHWAVLKKQFPALAASSAETTQVRLAILNALDAKLRLDIDRFARAKMLEQQPEKIAQALAKAPITTATIGLKRSGTDFSLPGIQESAELISLLENAALKGEVATAANDRLNNYTQDGNHFLKIQVISREVNKTLLSYAEASRDGTLDRLLDKKLEDAYPDVRKRDLAYFQESSGKWKPFKQVKDQVAKYVFADLLKTIEDNYRAYFGFLPGKEGDLPLSFYSNARLIPFMIEAQNALKANPADPTWLKTDTLTSDLSKQWLLEKSDQWMERCAKASFAKDDMFTLDPQSWSPVKIGEGGALAFFFVEEKGSSQTPSPLTVEQGHQILSHDAKRDIMLQILQTIQQKKAIALSNDTPVERQ